MLNQGVPTGGKHSVPLANILLCYIFVHALENEVEFRDSFESLIYLWKRFIDDCCGIFKGPIVEFLKWFTLLKSVFMRYSLELTCDTDSHTINDSNEHFEKQDKVITFLDVDVFKCNGTIHTKEHRKETSSNSYLHFDSAHPKHTFPGIVKSQLYRVRKLCSQESDYEEAVSKLKDRCINSGYDASWVNPILEEAKSIRRTLEYTSIQSESNDKEELRLVILSGTTYEDEFKQFAKRMNSLLKDVIKVQIVMSTGPTLGRLLFNNTNKVLGSIEPCGNDCMVCHNELQDKSGGVTSSVTRKNYNIEKNLTCKNGGIYVVKGACNSQYSGKTIHFDTRGNQHFATNSTAVGNHRKDCNVCNSAKDFSISFVENYLNRGKYSLSEREFFWNNRIKGFINGQKTLKKSQ